MDHAVYNLIHRALLGILLGLGMYTLVTQQFFDLLLIAAALAFSLIPMCARKIFSIHISRLLEASITLFMIGTIILGGMLDFYTRYWWWDLIFHTLSGLFFGLIAFVVLILVYQKRNVHFAPLFSSFFALLASIAISGLWEMAEFAIDQFFGTNLQPSNTDTMWDLIAGSGGALLSACSGYLYLAHTLKGPLGHVIEKETSNNKNTAPSTQG